VYRNPQATRPQAMNLDWLGGFALVTETRTVRLPAGPATIRFEGVAGGIVPVSAIVEGLPGGIVEKNRDARLLSAAALVEGHLGRRVTLTRTDRASGATRVEEAVIVAGPGNGVVVRTRDGVEALGCSGLADKPRYPGVPAGLSAGPVLSVATVSPRATTATVTLSYLSSEFDWAASYVATIAPDGRHLDLHAWLTLANGNPESFANAPVQAVAGRLNRRDERFRIEVPPLQLSCYPLGTTTSDLRTLSREDIVVTGFRVGYPAPPPVMESPMAVSVVSAEALAPEDLGDLKLYRAPERVTVAGRAQKQVALLSRARVPFQRVYRVTVQPGQPLADAPTAIALRLTNRADAGLGLPLPSGGTTLYARARGERLLVGTGLIGDKAVGESVRIAAGVSEQVRVVQTVPVRGQPQVEVTNANPFAVTVEIAVAAPAGNLSGAPLPLVDGVPTWTATVPANGRSGFTYAVR
jgi:hypothetical protein